MLMTFRKPSKDNLSLVFSNFSKHAVLETVFRNITLSCQVQLLWKGCSATEEGFCARIDTVADPDPEIVGRVVWWKPSGRKPREGWGW